MENRPGIVLVVALLIMAVMSIIGAAAMTTSRIDVQISQNTKVSRQAFYFADGGLEMSPKFVRRIINDGAIPAVQNVTLDPGLLNEVMGYATETDAVHPNSSAPDVTLSRGDLSLQADIDRTGTGYMNGSSVEFSSGAEGAGAGASGGVLIFYNLDSVGFAPRQAVSHVDAYYRYVVGVAGGK